MEARVDVRYTRDGIYLPALDLWLDPSEEKPAVFLSHGHADHARGSHGLALCTEATAGVHRSRGGTGSRHQIHAYGEAFDFRGSRLTFLPAGHIVGSAQLLVEHGDERLVYSGDLKLAPALCADPAVVESCDHLIVESTFGLPIFRFPPVAEVRQRIVDEARKALADGEVPVFAGYALGRGQELVDVLSEAGIPVLVHGAVARFLDLYRRHTGRALAAEPYERERISGHAVVGPSSFCRQLATSAKETRIVAVSGWALLDNARARYGADALVPYSDHSGFDELVTYVGQTGAKRIDVVHGFAEPFAAILRARGMNAQAPSEAAAGIDEDEAST